MAAPARGFGGTRTRGAAGSCVLVLTRALQRRSVAASISLQRRTRHYRVSHEASGRSSRRRSNRPSPRSRDRRPGIGAPLIRFVPLQRLPATSRCPGRPAAGRSRFGVVTCPSGRCGLVSLALAVFRFSAEAARSDRPLRSPIIWNRACTFASAPLASGHASPSCSSAGDVPLPDDSQANHGLAAPPPRGLPPGGRRSRQRSWGSGPSQLGTNRRRSRCFHALAVACFHPDIPTCRLVAGPPRSVFIKESTACTRTVRCGSRGAG